MSEKFGEILELFERKVGRHIEEVIKVDQTDAAVVKEELEEYVATDQIRRYYEDILERYRDTPNHPHEGIGVWISGFFGAGKSSFAKILGYVLENRELDGTSAAELFGRHTGDAEIQALLGVITEQIPTRSIIFDVSTDQVVTNASEKLTDIVYRVLLRDLGYATDRELAELEIQLEGQDRLSEFEETFERVFDGQTWEEVKHFTAFARNHASRVLHELDPETYPSADTWAKTPQEVEVSANFVAERTRELARRRAHGRAVVYIVDEVGQYVARSTDKMLDLQGLVQALGREGKNRASEWTGQVWLMVTSQERLSEVVDNLGGKQVELARLRDRFPIEVDLAPSDIREVTSKRVLKKKPAAREHLHELFQQHSGKLREGTRLSGSSEGDISAESFAELYPFLPFHVDLAIKVVSGLRTQRGAARHVGGANRTIIKLAQQVLINEKTDLGSRSVGALVTFDLVYELLEGLIAAERKHDVGEIEDQFGTDSMATKVAKALALLEFVKDVPRSIENLAAVLHPSVDSAPVRGAVEQALQDLQDVHKVRATDDGWELLSRVGKNWEEERRAIEVFPKQRTLVIQEAAEQIFEGVPGYRHLQLKTFKVRPVLNGQPVGRSGDVELRVQYVTDPDVLDRARDSARRESNTESGRNSLHWVVPIGDDLIKAVDELHRSRDMVRRHEPEKLSPEESRLLADEKSRETSQRGRVAVLLRQSFRNGDSYLRGEHAPLSEFGEEPSEQVRGALRQAIPELYPKFDLAAARIGTKDATKILEADRMVGLPAVYLEGEDGLGLVRKEGGEPAIVSDHAALREVAEYIQERKSFGEDATGRSLENRFTGFGYGWDLEIVKLLTATLFRDKKIEVYKGRRYTSYADPGVQEVFDKTQIFRSATFAPRKEGGVGLRELTACHETLKALYGEDLPIEEGAIAGFLRNRMPQEAIRAHRVLNLLGSLQLPGQEELRSLLTALEGVTQSSAEETLMTFHGQRESIARGLQRLKKLESALTDSNLTELREAQETVRRMWPELQTIGADSELAETSEALRAQLEDPEFFEHLGDIVTRSDRIRSAHESERSGLADELEEALRRHEDGIRNRPEWEALEKSGQEVVLEGFCQIGSRLNRTDASLSELQSHLRSLEEIHSQAVSELVRLTAENGAGEGEKPSGPVIRQVRAREFASSGLRTEEDVEQMLSALREACMDALSKGEIVVLE